MIRERRGNAACIVSTLHNCNIEKKTKKQLPNTKTSCLISVMVTWKNPLNRGFPLFTIRVEVVEYGISTQKDIMKMVC